MAAVVSPMPKPISRMTGRNAAERGDDIEWFRSVRDPQAWQQHVERPLLRGRHPTLPQHVAAHRTVHRIADLAGHCAERVP